MNYTGIGRIFLGLFLAGMGLLHLFFPGIRPLILPDATSLSPDLFWVRYVVAFLFTGAGILISLNKYVSRISLATATTFLLLFVFGHLPAFLSVHGIGKLKYWTNLNKMLALAGGFLVLASTGLNPQKANLFSALITWLALPGSVFFAIMLFLFGLGHFLSTASISPMVPDYIPFKTFWTIAAGVVLVGSAISIVVRFRVKKVAFFLAWVLLVWLLSLHLYYALLFPKWNDGENFIGSLTCLAFCGTALLISQKETVKASAGTTKPVYVTGS